MIAKGSRYVVLIGLISGCINATQDRQEAMPQVGAVRSAATEKAASLSASTKYPIENLLRSYERQMIAYGKNHEKTSKVLSQLSKIEGYQEYQEHEMLYELYSTDHAEFVRRVRTAYADATVSAATLIDELEGRRRASGDLTDSEKRYLHWLEWLETNWMNTAEIPPNLPQEYQYPPPARRRILSGK